MPELGSAALVVMLGLAVYALVAGAAAAQLGRRRLAQSAHNALTLSFASTAVAAVLVSALRRNDFSFAYVARTTSEALPTAHTISAFWGGQEGSLLLWLLLLTGFAAAALRTNRAWARDPVVWVNATEIRATLAVTRGDRDLGTLQAGKNAYTSRIRSRTKWGSGATR